MQGYEKTLISQYANSATIITLIEGFNQAVDPSANFDAFYTLIWDIETAQGYGLDLWGRIVGVTRELQITADAPYFGFSTGTDDFTPFSEAPFYSGTAVSTVYSLSDELFRTLILIKAAANISRTTAPVMNALLQKFFASRGRCYVNSLGGMAMRYTFEFYLEAFEVAILATSGAFPAPTGVQVYSIQQPPGTTFGFSEAGTRDSMPFGEGTFFGGSNIVNVIPEASGDPAMLGTFILGLNTLS